MINVSQEMLEKILGDTYSGTILDIIQESNTAIQDHTNDREYVAKHTKVIAAFIDELNKRN